MSEAAVRRPCVLVVDDDIEMATLLRDALAGEGFDAVAEISAFDALAAAERRPFDVIIVDKEIPGLNGLQLMEALRRRQPEVRLIFLTAFGGSLVARAARKHGADGYLDKPVRLEHLVTMVRAVLNASRRVS